MVVRLELFVEDTDAVPQLGVSNVFEAVEGLLVRVECFVDVVREEVAMPNCCPRGPVFRVDFGHLEVVLCSCDVVSLGPMELSHLGVVLEVGDGRVFVLDGLHLIVRLRNLLGRLGRLGEGLGREVGLIVWVVQDLGKLLLLFLIPN